jgi:hypothetical protein
LNKTTIVVISAHARFISAMPIFLLGWVFACYGPSAFYLADVRVGSTAKDVKNGIDLGKPRPQTSDFT